MQYYKVVTEDETVEKIVRNEQTDFSSLLLRNYCTVGLLAN